MLYHNSYPNKGILQIIFQDNVTLKNTIIEATENELLSSVFRKYIYKTGKCSDNLKFLFNGKKLDPSLTVSQAALSQHCRVTVTESGIAIGGGGFSMDFTDLSKQQYQEYICSNNAPSYRAVHKGLNICGNCKFRKCIAYKQEVIIPLKSVKRFDLIKESENLECPSCGSIVSPKTVAFFLCRYKVSGKKYENDKIKPFEFVGMANNKNAVQYYDPIKNGKVRVIDLIIEILEFL